MQPATPQRWPILSGLWRIVLLSAKVLMAGFLGVWICGLTAGLLTFYCYFIGAMLGIPLGLVLGIVASFKFPTKDVFFAFGLGVATWIVIDQVQGPKPEPGFAELVYEFTPTTIGALVAGLALATRSLIPSPVKKYAGATLSLAILALGVTLFLKRIYAG